MSNRTMVELNHDYYPDGDGKGMAPSHAHLSSIRRFENITKRRDIFGNATSFRSMSAAIATKRLGKWEMKIFEVVFLIFHTIFTMGGH
jgi:hypothetical protein